MKKNFKKRFLSIILATVLCLSSNLTAFAANIPVPYNDATTTSEDEYGIMPCAIGDSIGYDGIISQNGLSGEFVITLDRSYFNIYIRAGATGNANNFVYCTVTFPDGEEYPLGNVIADGSKTSYLCYDGTAPAGDYTFKFDGSDPGTTGFLGFMYKSAY